MLAVIEAFASDRMLDAQVRQTVELCVVLEHARQARDAAIRRVFPRAADGEYSYNEANRRTLVAITAERTRLGSGTGASFAEYLATSREKQWLGFPASLALASAAQWDARRRGVLLGLLSDICVALQVHDDVVDWEDDATHGGAWAVALSSDGSGGDKTSARPPLATRVHESRILVHMLRASAHHFGRARRRAAALRLSRIATWATDRETALRDLTKHEELTPGYTARLHALSTWAKAVLS
jgi:hypothetical protein